MYSVKKISTTALRNDVYDYEFEYATWRDLVNDLDDRSHSANEVFMGRGSAIFRGDEQIGHTSVFNQLYTLTKRVTLKQFLAEAADMATA